LDTLILKEKSRDFYKHHPHKEGQVDVVFCQCKRCKDNSVAKIEELICSVIQKSRVWTPFPT